jgi:hypothetical protein
MMVVKTAFSEEAANTTTVPVTAPAADDAAALDAAAGAELAPAGAEEATAGADVVAAGADVAGTAAAELAGALDDDEELHAASVSASTDTATAVPDLVRCMVPPQMRSDDAVAASVWLARTW